MPCLITAHIRYAIKKLRTKKNKKKNKKKQKKNFTAKTLYLNLKASINNV